MPVEISEILRVLAHELRTPVGVAQGYVRMLLEDRLADVVDQRRALEQTNRALARVAELSQEESTLAAWFDESDRPADKHTDAATLFARVASEAELSPPPTLQASAAIGSLLV